MLKKTALFLQDGFPNCTKEKPFSTAKSATNSSAAVVRHCFSPRDLNLNRRQLGIPQYLLLHCTTHSHLFVRLSHRLILIGANKWNSSIFTSPLTAQYTLIFLSDFLIDSSQSHQIKLEIPHRIVTKPLFLLTGAYSFIEENLLPC